MRRALLFLIIVSTVGAATLATPGAVRADDEWLQPQCTTTAYDPYTTFISYEYDNVRGYGTIACSAGGGDWAAQWTMDICIQKWVRPDDQFYDVDCRHLEALGDNRTPWGQDYANQWCSYGYGEYRTIVHTTWFVDYWHHGWAISNVTWNCQGH